MNAQPEAAKPKKRRPARPIYVRVDRMIDPRTGEMVGCLVPCNRCDRVEMKRRQFRVGLELRAEIKQARNVGFHRLAHAIGTLAVKQLPGFETMDAHEAVKKLQAETGVCCDISVINLGIGRDARGRFVNLGTAEVATPHSIAFDEMPEADFQRLVQAIFGLLSTKYWPDLTPDAVEQLVQMEMGR